MCSELINEIIEKTAQVMGVDVAALYKEHKGGPEVTMVRWLVWKILRSLGVSLKACAEVFGLKDHTTVMHAMQEVDKKIATVKEMGLAWEQVKHYMNDQPLYKKSKPKKYAAFSR